MPAHSALQLSPGPEVPARGYRRLSLARLGRAGESAAGLFP